MTHLPGEMACAMWRGTDDMRLERQPVPALAGRDVLIRGLASAGWEVPSPEASMFAWAPIPPRFAGLGSVEFSKLLLARAKVAVSPGLGFGEHGEGYVRIGLVENTHRLRQAVRNIRAFLQSESNVAAPVSVDEIE